MVPPLFHVNVKEARELCAVSCNKPISVTLHMFQKDVHADLLQAVVGRAPNPSEFAYGFVSQEIGATDEEDFATELGVLARPRKLGNNLFRHQASEKCKCNKVLDTFLQYTRVFLKVLKCSHIRTANESVYKNIVYICTRN